MNQNVKVEDTEICVCGHLPGKHRERGNRTCRKCYCKEYIPAVEIDGRLVPAPHMASCRCAECAWERLENAERNILELRDRLDEQQTYINNVLRPAKQMIDSIANAVSNTLTVQRNKLELETTIANALVKKAEKEAQPPKTVSVPHTAKKSISEQLKKNGGKIDREEKPVQPKRQTPPTTP